MRIEQQRQQAEDRRAIAEGERQHAEDRRFIILKDCTKTALDSLRAASNLAVEASGAR